MRGVACFGFCDFGDNFTVLDKNGEEPADFFISHISQVRERGPFKLHVYSVASILLLLMLYFCCCCCCFCL